MAHEITVERDGVQLTLKNTLRAVICYRAWEQAWPTPDGAVDGDLRTDFRWAMAHLVACKGLAWKAPTSTSTEEEVEAAYQQYADQGNLELLREAAQAASALHRPTANEVERPDETLSEAQTTDPN